MENSVTVNGVTYDFIITDNKTDMFGMGQNCIKCEMPKLKNPYYCKFCSGFLLVAMPFKNKKEHYFKKRI